MGIRRKLEQRIGRQARECDKQSWVFEDRVVGENKARKTQPKAIKRSFREVHGHDREWCLGCAFEQCVQASQQEIKVIKNDIAELKTVAALIDEKTRTN
jgi:hypothetical protein